MDPARFDRFARVLAASTNRRTLMKALVLTGIASVGAVATSEAEAAKGQCNPKLKTCTDPPCLPDLPPEIRPSHPPYPVLSQPYPNSNGVSVSGGEGICCHKDTFYNEYYAIDFVGNGTFPVLAAASGTAAIGSCGTVFISHGDFWVTVYAHMVNISVKHGACVLAGQQIGMAGSECAGAVHLHFELRGEGKSSQSCNSYSYDVPAFVASSPPCPDGASIDKNCQCGCPKGQVLCPNGCVSTNCDKGLAFDANTCECGCPTAACGSSAHADRSNKCKCVCDDPAASMCSNGSCKTCGPNAKLNKQTCECECKKLGYPDSCGNACFAPCDGGRTRDSDTCECLSTCPDGTSFCAGRLECAPLCGTDEWRDENLCQCFCNAGLERCGDQCIDLAFADEHCGACDQPCSALDGERCCSGVCVYPDSDPANCGGCGEFNPANYICTDGMSCISGECIESGGCHEYCDDSQRSTRDCCHITVFPVGSNGEPWAAVAPGREGDDGEVRVFIDAGNGQRGEPARSDDAGYGNSPVSGISMSLPPGNYVLANSQPPIGRAHLPDLPVTIAPGDTQSIVWGPVGAGNVTFRAVDELGVRVTQAPSTEPYWFGMEVVTDVNAPCSDNLDQIVDGECTLVDVSAGHHDFSAQLSAGGPGYAYYRPAFGEYDILSGADKTVDIVFVPWNPSSISASQSVSDCADGLRVCDGQCVDPSSDPRNCGACGRMCGDGECKSGECIFSSCTDGLMECGGMCADITSDPLNCGGCGMICSSELCVNSSCSDATGGGEATPVASG